MKRLTYQIADRLNCLADKLRRYDVAYIRDLTPDCPHVETCRKILDTPEFKAICERITK